MLNKMANARGFAALNENSINLASVKPADVHESTPKAVGALMLAMAKSPEADDKAVCDAIEEYFRQKFRKLSFAEATAIMVNLGFDPANRGDSPPQKIQGLDDKFWVWETLEEASRPQIEEISKEDMVKFIVAWGVQIKGSEELNDMMQERIYAYFQTSPFDQ